MSKDALLIEAVTLAEEVVEMGAGEGRGIRLAGLVLRLNEAMMSGDVPMSWSPSMPPPGASEMPTIPRPPRLPPEAAPIEPWKAEAFHALPGPEELDAVWHTLISDMPPKKLTLAPPEEQPSESDPYIMVDDGDYI